MEGQLSLFDIRTGPKRPCDYRFKRYIGQKVGLSVTSGDYIGKIVGIEPYYTEIEVPGTDCTWAGTPTTCYPINKEEYDESC